MQEKLENSLPAVLNVLDVGPGIGLFFGHAFIRKMYHEPWHTLLFQPISLQILGYGKGSPILFVLMTKLPMSKKKHIRKVVAKICWYLTVKTVTWQVLLISIFNLKVSDFRRNTQDLKKSSSWLKWALVWLIVCTAGLAWLFVQPGYFHISQTKAHFMVLTKKLIYLVRNIFFKLCLLLKNQSATRSKNLKVKWE